MSQNNVRIRIKIGQNEAEIEAPREQMRELIDLLPEFVKSVSNIQQREDVSISMPRANELPEIRVEKGESLPSIIVKLFYSSWGRQPRKLLDVKEALESFGLIYPKQSVAVSLLRLAKEGKLRRFKQADGEFVYTASTSLLPFEQQVAGEVQQT
ncbi:MAG: hypothetical protein QXR69_03220 [Conexivisphaerales archaeon]